jgi:uncharacterized protein (DUF983 family)
MYNDDYDPILREIQRNVNAETPPGYEPPKVVPGPCPRCGAPYVRLKSGFFKDKKHCVDPNCGYEW